MKKFAIALIIASIAIVGCGSSTPEQVKTDPAATNTDGQAKAANAAAAESGAPAAPSTTP